MTKIRQTKFPAKTLKQWHDGNTKVPPGTFRLIDNQKDLDDFLCESTMADDQQFQLLKYQPIVAAIQIPKSEYVGNDEWDKKLVFVKGENPAQRTACYKNPIGCQVNSCRYFNMCPQMALQLLREKKIKRLLK